MGRKKLCLMPNSDMNIVLHSKSGDKEEALAVGRKYYQNLRNGEPTESDEQAISRDLSLIKKV